MSRMKIHPDSWVLSWTNFYFKRSIAELRAQAVLFTDRTMNLFPIVLQMVPSVRGIAARTSKGYLFPAIPELFETPLDCLRYGHATRETVATAYHASNDQIGQAFQIFGVAATFAENFWSGREFDIESTVAHAQYQNMPVDTSINAGPFTEPQFVIAANGGRQARTLDETTFVSGGFAFRAKHIRGMQKFTDSDAHRQARLGFGDILSRDPRYQGLTGAFIMPVAGLHEVTYPVLAAAMDCFAESDRESTPELARFGHFDQVFEVAE